MKKPKMSPTEAAAKDEAETAEIGKDKSTKKTSSKMAALKDNLAKGGKKKKGKKKVKSIADLRAKAKEMGY